MCARLGERVRENKAPRDPLKQEAITTPTAKKTKGKQPHREPVRTKPWGGRPVGATVQGGCSLSQTCSADTDWSREEVT